MRWDEKIKFKRSYYERKEKILSALTGKNNSQ